MKTPTTKTSTNRYITLTDGIDFRKIAKIMTKAGFVMNHATSRNVLVSAIRLLLDNVASQFGTKITEEKMINILHNQQLHDALSEVLSEIYKTHNKKEEIN